MDEERENYMDEDMVGAVNRFKHSLISGRTRYFDVSEFEGIVEQLLDEGDIQGSEIAVKQGIQIHPNAVPLQLKYAHVLINKGKYEKSLQYLHFAEKIDSSNPDIHLLKGSARMIMGNEPDALLSFKKAIKYAGSEIDEILYHIGAAYVQVGNIKKAVYYFKQTIRANPKNEMALYDLGFFYDQLEDYKKSIKYYNDYLDIDTFNHLVWFNLGTVYNKSENQEKAIEAYEFSYALNDSFHMALFNIGNALANVGKFDEAIKKYNDFLEIEPENDDAFCYIGECFLNLEEYTKSEFYYQKALQINKDNDTAWFGIGLIMWIEHRHEESIENINKAIKIDDSNSEYWLSLGKVKNDSDNIKGAISALKNAARIDSENSDIWLTWAEIYGNSGELNNAIRILRTGIKHNDNSVLKFRLVAFLLQNRKRKEAMNLLVVALEQDFEQLEYLFDVYPRSIKNKRLNKIVANFKKENNLE